MRKTLPKVLQIAYEPERDRLTWDGWDIHCGQPLEVLMPDRPLKSSCRTGWTAVHGERSASSATPRAGICLATRTCRRWACGQGKLTDKSGKSRGTPRLFFCLVVAALLLICAAAQIAATQLPAHFLFTAHAPGPGCAGADGPFWPVPALAGSAEPAAGVHRPRPARSI